MKTKDEIAQLKEAVDELYDAIELVMGRIDAVFGLAQESLAFAKATADELQLHAEQGCWSVSSN